MSEICPNCDEPADVLVAPDERRPREIVDSERHCHIGTMNDEYPGYKFYHGVTTE